MLQVLFLKKNIYFEASVCLHLVHQTIAIAYFFSWVGATLAGYTAVLFLKWNLSDYVALSFDILSLNGDYCLFCV